MVASACGLSRTPSTEGVAFRLETGSADSLTTIEVDGSELDPIVNEVMASDRFVANIYQQATPADIRADVATRVLYEEVIDIELAKADVDPDSIDTSTTRELFVQQLVGVFANEADPELAAQEVNEEVDSYLELLARFVSKQVALGEALLGDQSEPEMLQLPCARHILVAEEEEANDILAQLDDGADFSELAIELSIDTGSGAQGGSLGCADPNNYVPEFRDAVIAAEIGEVVGPVQSQFGFHLIIVDEIQEQPAPAADPALAASPVIEASLRQAVVIFGPALSGFQWDQNQLAIFAVSEAGG